MIKQRCIKNICICLSCLLILFLLYLFPKSDDLVTNGTTYKRPNITNAIYPINNDGYVSRIKVPLKEKNKQEKIKEIIEYLKADSTKSELLPKGFFPTIPKDTILLKVSIDNKNANLYFNQNLNSDNIETTIESLIYSITSLKEIDSISIYIDNTLLSKIPNSNTYLPEKLDKSFGINKKYDIESIKNTTKTTIYYTAKNDSMNYFIPITKVSNEDISKVEIIIKELTSKPTYETNLMSYLNAETTLNKYEFLNKEINLEFNNAILNSIDNKSDLEEVTYAINLSIKSNYDVDYVSYIVENKKIATFDLKDLEN